MSRLAAVGCLMALLAVSLLSETKSERELRLKLEVAQAEIDQSHKENEALTKGVRRLITLGQYDTAPAPGVPDQGPHRYTTDWWSTFSSMMAAASLLGSILWYAIRITIRKEILESNSQQLKQINGTYLKSADSNMSGAEIQRCLEGLRIGLDSLTAYAHGAVHRLSNTIQRMQSQADVAELKDLQKETKE